MLPIDLHGKVAIVTGSTQGIGLGIAAVMANAGCQVAGCGRSDTDSAKARNFLHRVQHYGQKAFLPAGGREIGKRYLCFCGKL